MKKILKKFYGLLLGVGCLFMLGGRYYPDETATDNYIAAGINIVASVFSLLALIGAILSFFNKK